MTLKNMKIVISSKISRKSKCNIIYVLLTLLCLFLLYNVHVNKHKTGKYFNGISSFSFGLSLPAIFMNVLGIFSSNVCCTIQNFVTNGKNAICFSFTVKGFAYKKGREVKLRKGKF